MAAPSPVPALTSHHPAIKVTQHSDLTNGEAVTIRVTGFGVQGTVWLYECSARKAANDAGCGVELAGQTFLITNNERAGTARFRARSSAPTPPLNITTPKPCSTSCVLVASQGVGGAWAETPIAFREPTTSVAVGPPVHSPSGCVPHNYPTGSQLANGANRTVDKGQVLYIVLDEPEETGTPPTSFPWPTPTSSNFRVLTRVPLCKYLNVSAEALTVTAFRALRDGTATVTAPLSRAWQTWQANHKQVIPGTPQEPFQSFRASVTVARN